MSISNLPSDDTTNIVSPSATTPNMPRSRTRRTISGVKNASGALFSSAMKNGEKYVKGAIKYGAMGAGAATLGSVGLIAGLASDKPGDALKYAGVGLASGALVGSKLVGVAESGIKGTEKLVSGASGISGEFKKGYLRKRRI